MTYKASLQVWLGALLLLNSGGLSGAETGPIRTAAVAGQFYPGDGAQLRSEITHHLAKAPAASVPGEILGLCAPHAGYLYSACTAAAAYKAVSGRSYDLIVILAPSHQEYFTGATIYPGQAYETPLGRVEIDSQAATRLSASCRFFRLSATGHGPREHSLEVQLPFVQHLFPGTPILPIMIGSCEWESCAKMGKALGSLLAERKALIIASTDLYHGYSYDAGLVSDAATLAAITRMEPRALHAGMESGQYQACGGTPLAVMQVAALERGRCNGKIVARTNSGDVTGDKSGYIVGYAAGLFYLQEKAMNRQQFQPLPVNAQIELLSSARESIKHYLKHGTMPELHSSLPVLQEKRGVFVTITRNGALRGCIGMHEADKPLYLAVPDRAVAAAFEDPRFMPLQMDELDKIKIKISVYLTDVYEAESIDDFVMGKHGIILIKGSRAATYLPEVPLEAGWKSKEEEMASLCQKAGLPANGWREGAKILLYETQVFDESLLK